MKYFILWSYCILFGIDLTGQQAEHLVSQDESTPLEILLFGTFHFNNPGADVAKTKEFDILSTDSQKQLDQIALKIKAYQPIKIFVEWPWDEQDELDSLYTKYLSDSYFHDSLSNFYLKNEIFQLAFRAAKLLGHAKVYAIDYTDTSFPYERMMTVIEQNGQTALADQFEALIQRFTSSFDDLIQEGASLATLFEYLNTRQIRQLDRQFYTDLATRAGAVDQFIGPQLVSEWYKRNIYMWSLLQKSLDRDDKKVMVLLGSSHVSMLAHLLDGNPKYRLREIKDL